METLGRRIAIIGPPCSGKTTLSRVIGGRFGLPVIELDSIYWQPNWTPLEPSEFTRQVAAVASQEEWVIDGNYSATRDVVWPRAECFLWLDLALPIVLIRVARRSLRRWLSREELWNGNRENLRTLALSRDSLFLWSLRTHHPRRHLYGRLFQHERRPVVRLRTPREAQRFCEGSLER